MLLKRPFCVASHQLKPKLVKHALENSSELLQIIFIPLICLKLDDSISRTILGGKCYYYFNHHLHIIKNILRASLVAQWLRICLPMQGTQVRALVWEDPTCLGATGPVSHNH